MNASAIQALALRAATLRASAWPSTLTYEGTDYACTIDPTEITRVIEAGGWNEEQSFRVVVATSTGFSPTHGYAIMIKTTVTDALEGESFKITGIDRHPINPEIVLTLAKKV